MVSPDLDPCTVTVCMDHCTLALMNVAYGLMFTKYLYEIKFELKTVLSGGHLRGLVKFVYRCRMM